MLKYLDIYIFLMAPQSQKKIQEFKNAVQKNILLTKANRDYLVANANKLPAKIIEIIFREIKSQNLDIEKYTQIAVATDPEIITKFKKKGNLVKQKLHELKEKEEAADYEKELDEVLKNL